jgi:YidC/Oxa1 family membrane protein insertase
LWRTTLEKQPTFRALRLDELILYNIGGPCAFCTFQWLARLLFTFLSFMHDHVVFDWSIAIMLLVVGVRAALHPITRRSQIGLMRFGKQMAAIAPKQQKLREKYGADQKKLQQEMMKLYREENVKFSGALGCLPMFLQSPVWIALYAMLFFAFDLRHHPAFYGVVQRFFPDWAFLADLSAPDRFIDFGRDIHIPLLSSFMGPLHSINLLPLLLGIVFFIQQKYLTPPPSAAMSPEQETQQKIMKVMMVVMFPLLMYNTPSGLVIYFITNSVLGILESRYIRSHVDKLELEPKKPAGEQGRKAVVNQAANPFARSKQREGSPWKSREDKKK